MVKSMSVSEDVYTELRNAGVLLAFMSGKEDPYTAEEMLAMSVKQMLSHIRDNGKDLRHVVHVPVSLQLLKGEGKLSCRIGEYMENKKFRTRTVQKAAKIPTTTIYTIATGERLPSVDTLFRLLPALQYPSLDELFTRTP